MTEQLKPCPFCGGQPKRVSTSLSERFAYAQEVSYVCSCGCRRSARGDTSKGGYADNSKVEENALAAWNTRALTQRPAAQTEREADGYGSTDLPWSFTVCRELEPQEKRLMSMLVSAFGSDHPAIDDMAHLILNRPASLPTQPAAQATPVQDVGASADYWGDLAQQKADADARRGVSMPVSYYTSSIVGALLATQQATPDVPETDFGNMATQQAAGEPVGWMHTSGVVHVRHSGWPSQTVKAYTPAKGWAPLYTSPAPGVLGMSDRTHFTYKNQPFDNVICWRLGEAARSSKPGGDLIDHGLSLLRELEERGYGIFLLAAAQAKNGPTKDQPTAKKGNHD